MWKLATFLIIGTFLSNLSLAADHRVKRQVTNDGIDPQDRTRIRTDIGTDSDLGRPSGSGAFGAGVAVVGGAQNNQQPGITSLNSRPLPSPVQNRPTVSGNSGLPQTSGNRPLVEVSPSAGPIRGGRPEVEREIGEPRRRPSKRPNRRENDDDYDDSDENPRRGYRRQPGGASASASTIAGFNRGKDEYYDDSDYDHHPFNFGHGRLPGLWNNLWDIVDPQNYGGLFPRYSDYGYYDNDRDGAFVGASSSASSNSDGSSRLSGSVTNNGQTRGYVTNTDRYGRSDTRRFGGRGSDEYDDDD